MLFRTSVIGFLLVLMLPACSLSQVGDSEKSRLEKHRAHWQEHGPSDYQFDLQKWSFGPRGLFPATIVVRADTVRTVLDPETGTTLVLPQTEKPALETNPGAYPTVLDLFAVVERAIEEDYKHLEVQYDEQLGYPEHIESEIAEDMADDYVTYEVSNFKQE